ncbi:methionine ABC transporter substrate-binding protein [Paenibacillus baekrokdamisoli]|uniref:Lipoprotein n=1 Tax=Paenibacillus baekrokdamisoli TaxID=1712516 RepID=A0A3G9J627_9BACL|nr:MetQ/NlpA family ABC transporter substrate-binding protein [Paenibacillus baekrokdamisoli]MBB3070205.1 D-methionine transport system substrate-binding protein [Paenibacillus baekrokdamisoli]BBH21211.1 methionine ABC transporter substrate-binding protein [Paenibacillus baekrokdamisoli]
MKKWSLILLTIVLAVVLTACGSSKEKSNTTGNEGTKEVTLKVGATPVPHAEILEEIKPILKEKGINLEIVPFNDFVQPNTQLYEKELDANFFQHIPYLEQFNKDKGYNLVNVGGVHIEPFGAYSKKVKSINELKEGAKVVIPNDPSNGGRALALMAANNLIKLKDGVGVAGTVADITENPKKLDITEVEAATLPRVLDEVDLALINTNYALEAGLVPTKDALFIEGPDSPYVNILVARPDNKDSEAIQTLIKTLQSPEVKKFIEDKYKGAIVPAFK